MSDLQLPVRQPSRLPLPALPIRTILVATDFSDHATAVEGIAAGLARQSMARLILVHVFVQSEYARAAELDVSLQEKILFKVEERPSHQLQARSAALRAAGTDVEFALIGHSSASEGIKELAREKKADLIVIGTHGRTGFQQLVLGSVAEGVVRSAPCSVLTIHSPRWPYHEGPVLVPTDFSRTARAALDYASELAWLKHSKIEVVHVFDDAPAGSSLPFFANEEVEKWCRAARATAQEKVGELAKEVARAGLTLEARLLEGPPAQTIVTEAENIHASLIVLASSRDEAWRKALLGSTAERVVRLANCPVLIVRPSGEEASDAAAAA